MALAVVAIEEVLSFGRRKDQFVAAAELDKRGPVLPHPLPSLLKLFGIAENQFGPTGGQVESGLGDLGGAGLGIARHRPGHQPRPAGRVDRYQAGVEEASLGHSMERRPPDIRVRAVLQVVDQVQQDDGIPFLTLDLEDALHRVPPTEQHLPVDRGQVLPSSDEAVHHGRTVRQAVPQDEVVDDPDRLALVQLPLRPCGLQQEGRQPPVKAGALPEGDQLPFQLGTALDEVGQRRFAAALMPALYDVSHVALPHKPVPRGV